MFACGNYPCFPSFLNSVKREAILNVRRLRHHSSLAVFAGNNEDYQLAESAGLQYDYADQAPESWLKTDFPARYIYECLLPDIIQSECPTIPYRPGSPWSGGSLSSDPTVGDLHQWNVWNGTQEKYQIFNRLGGRFNSEFGMESFPHLETVKEFIGDEPRDLYPQSRLMDFHNKAAGHERRLATYLVENVRTVTDIEPYIHLTQLIQSEALAYAFRSWRRQWSRRGGERQCGGALVWQLNDCYPTISWSICDYHLRKKPAYYTTARCLAPLAVGIHRHHWDWTASSAHEPRHLRWELWAASSLLQDAQVDIELRFLGVEDGHEVCPPVVQRAVIAAANATTDKIVTGTIDADYPPYVIAARMWRRGSLVARDMDWPQPLKYLSFPHRNVSVCQDGDCVRVSVEKPVKCLVLEERDGYVLSDNALDLVPGDEQVVRIEGRKEGDEKLSWMYLGQGEQ
jgi:beta-mannosidase